MVKATNSPYFKKKKKKGDDDDELVTYEVLGKTLRPKNKTQEKAIRQNLKSAGISINQPRPERSHYQVKRGQIKGGWLNGSNELAIDRDGGYQTVLNANNLSELYYDHKPKNSFKPSYKGKDPLDFTSEDIREYGYQTKVLGEDPDVNLNTLLNKYEEKKKQLKEKYETEVVPYIEKLENQDVNSDKRAKKVNQKFDNIYGKHADIKQRLKLLNKLQDTSRGRALARALNKPDGYYRGFRYYDLNEKFDDKYNIDPLERVKEDKKNKYFDYLKSQQYRETAEEMWDDNVQKNINQQLGIVEDTSITTPENMGWGSIKEFLRNSGRKAKYNEVNNDITTRSRVAKGVQHELSHATDAKIHDFPDDFLVTKWEETKGGRTNEGLKINPKYKDDPELMRKLDGMQEKFSKWEERFDGGSYLKKPTEVRARINSIRSKMYQDGFNWNNASQDEIMDYLKNRDHGDLIETQIKQLDYLDPSDWEELLKKYASINGTELDSIAEEVKNEII